MDNHKEYLNIVFQMFPVLADNADISAMVYHHFCRHRLDSHMSVHGPLSLLSLPNSLLPASGAGRMPLSEWAPEQGRCLCSRGQPAAQPRWQLDLR